MKKGKEIQYTLQSELPLAGNGKTHTVKEWKRIYGYTVGLVAGAKWISTEQVSETN